VILICSINSYAEEIKPLPENIKSYQTSNFLNYLEKAAQETRKEAENGNAEAQYALGNIYASGLGVKQDDLQAVIWWKKAASQGNPKAETSLGNMYLQGRGGLWNSFIEAMKLWESAAAKNDSLAQLQLAVSYRNGRIASEQDFELGLEWLIKSAEQGNIDAQSYLGHSYLTGQGVEKIMLKL
jgi:TPR repeat protein